MTTVKTKSFELAVYAKGDKNAKKLALVLPGRLDTKDYAHMTSLVDRLAKEGYLAISFDPPGTWESPGDIALYTTDNYLLSIRELIEHFGNRPTVVIGHSRGGSLALLSAVKIGEVEKCAAVMSNYAPSTPKPVSIAVGFEQSFRDLPPGTQRTDEKKEFKLPVSYFDDGDAFKLSDLAKCAKPKLFFWGNADNLITKDVVMSSYNAALSPKEIIELDSEHDYRLNPTIVNTVNETVVKFLSEN